VKLEEFLDRYGARVPSWLATFLFRLARRIPAVRRGLDTELDKMLGEVSASLRPYRNDIPTFASLPDQGRDHDEVLGWMATMRDHEQDKWRDGRVSGAVYHGEPDHVAYLNDVYAMHSQCNPLHPDVWPSQSKYEAEIVSMTAGMLGSTGDDGICGTVSSGGTESILLAMKACRNHAVKVRGIRRPELLVPETAHAAFDKACEMFGMHKVTVPVGKDCRADVKRMKKAISWNTAVIVGSAPSFPHGAIDPIEELSNLALANGIPFHTDACLGGFVLPWAEQLGAPVPRFDFRLPGVTSISVDTHKYGYAAKGTSVVLYRNPELRRHQYFTTETWPGGLYFSPTIAGSRPGGLSAACWATLVGMGAQGYLDATRRILASADALKAGIRAIPELHVLGDPLWVVAFGSEVLDIYRVMDVLASKGWSLNGLHRPPCLHLCVTLRHPPEVIAQFCADLREAVEFVKAHPAEKGGMAPVYGLASRMPVRGVVGDLLERYMDVLFKV
jgi:sphinganine-1-phosphate aldolase